ncbi:hypothetical protein [Streptomyces flavofungini]|uniref:hypothetical protein n=1 Tax=Streptomyces flavofungini TaxID=68200 RepID=UPI0025AFE13E|nr:hypothetical protein [Streptomyces flavofungini]WJV48586.1 hypothetical protein QUY26_25560 [Streptomyces flavofungini]
MRVSGAAAARGGALLAAALALALALALAGCQKSPGTERSSARPPGDNSPAGSAGSGYGAVFLGADECSSRGLKSFTEVPCGSERAAARVIARHGGRASDGPLCPGRTDFVLHISANRPSVDEDGDGAVPQGYACMRNLEFPHPGDPGAGGGPRTVVGDCVYGDGRGRVRETACDGSGRRAPEYRVAAAVRSRDLCPVGTQLYVALGGGRPVGCAVRV